MALADERRSGGKLGTWPQKIRPVGVGPDVDGRRLIAGDGHRAPGGVGVPGDVGPVLLHC